MSSWVLVDSSSVLVVVKCFQIKLLLNSLNFLLVWTNRLCHVWLLYLSIHFTRDKAIFYYLVYILFLVREIGLLFESLLDLVGLSNQVCVTRMLILLLSESTRLSTRFKHTTRVHVLEHVLSGLIRTLDWGVVSWLLHHLLALVNNTLIFREWIVFIVLYSYWCLEYLFFITIIILLNFRWCYILFCFLKLLMRIN